MTIQKIGFIIGLGVLAIDQFTKPRGTDNAEQK